MCILVATPMGAETMIRHAEITEFEYWQRRADDEERVARAHVGAGEFDAACRAAGRTARHALTGMMRGIWSCVQRSDTERWSPAFGTALEAAGARRIRGPLQRLVVEDCPTAHPDRHDVIDAADALADLARIRTFAETAWRLFTAELDHPGDSTAGV